VKNLIAGIVLALTAATSAFAQAECSDTRVDLRGPWGTARFTVEIADTTEKRATGLMNRPSMPASSGMLFLYETAQRVGFWMENTLIPLDMLFLSPDGVVRRIHENAIPLDRTVIPGGDGIQAVLEINGGMSALLGITVGSELRHPMMDQSIAAWDCAEN